MPVKRHLFLMFWTSIFAFFLVFSYSWINCANGQEESGTSEQVIKKLEKQINELQDGNALLMENLANCTEENDSLREKLDDGEKMGSQEEKAKKRTIIKLIQNFLKTQNDLSFLMKLQEDQLKTLLDIIMKRVQ